MNTASANQEVNKSINKRSPRFNVGHVFNFSGTHWKILDILKSSQRIVYYCQRTKSFQLTKYIEEKDVT
jgi:hypothetical protein